MNIVVLGAPGVGKGTYTSRLSKEYKIPHVSTGDLLRESVKKGTKLGLKAESFMDNGKLVPDKLVIELLKERLRKEDCEKGFFLDGFPRTLEQARHLSKITKIDFVLNFITSEKIIVDRISGRLTCKGCGKIYNTKHKKLKPKEENKCDYCNDKLYRREDEKDDVVRERLKEYYEKTEPLISYYDDLIKEVDSGVDFDEADKVLEEISLILKG